MRVFLGIVLFVAVLAAFSERDLQPAPAHAEPPLPELVDISHLEHVAETGLPQPTEFERLVSEPQPTLAAPEWQESVYPVRVIVGGSTYSGSAVAVSPTKLHSAKHVWQAGGTPEVEIDGKWIKANPTGVATKDLLVLTVADPVLKPVNVRVPIYGEPVIVYGLRTKSSARGRYCGDLSIALGSGIAPLESGETAVDNGDSGGGVFGEDGSLLGTITGHVSDSKLLTLFVPIVADPPKASAPEAKPPAVSANPPAVSNCPGGVCRQPQNPWTFQNYWFNKRSRR